MTADRDERLDEIVADYLRKRESGCAVDAEQWIADHPEFADDLREFLADERHIGRLARPLAEPVITHEPVPERVRYFGDFELLEEIARGGMGIVYRARQTSLNRIVAVKMILAGHLADETDTRRFQVEAEAAANLRHPNIVAVHEVGRHGGQSYFSMDYVDGKNLSEVTRHHLLPFEQAARYVLQIAEAIHYAHSQGTLHRDLKPSNVLIDSAGEVRITDFGLAGRVEADSDLTKTDQTLGTPGYMPPEQARNRRDQIGPASDIYALGATLYELLTGRPPFRAESPVVTLWQVIHDDPVPPRLLNSRIPRDLETICLKCLEKDPPKRYGTAQLLADDLQRYLQGEPVLARPIGKFARLTRWCRRKPALAGLFGTVTVAVFALVIVLWISNVRVGNALSDKTDALTKLQSQQRITENALSDKQRALNAKGKALTERDAANARLRASLQSQQWLTYVRGIHLAQREYNAGNVLHADEILDNCGPRELRAFEWHYLKSLCRQSALWTWRGRVSRWALSNRGTALLFHKGSNRICDSVSGKSTSIPMKTFAPYAIMSPNGERVAYKLKDTAREPAGIQLIDTRTGARRIIAAGVRGVSSRVHFSKDGNRVAGFTRWKRGVGRLQIWNVATGRSEKKLDSKLFDPLLHRVGRSVLGLDPTLRYVVTFQGVVDTKTDREIIRFRTRPSCCAFSRDGRLLAVSEFNGVVKILETATAKFVSQWNSPAGRVDSLAFSTDAKQLAAGATNGDLSVINVTTGKQQFRIQTGKAIREVAFSPDNERLLTAHRDFRNNGSIRVWSNRSPQTLVIDGAVTSSRSWGRRPAFSPDGHLIATVGADNDLVLWETLNGDVVRRIPAPVGLGAITFSPDGKQIAAAENERFRIWRVADGRLECTLTHRQAVIAITCAFSPDGRLLAGGYVGGATVWNWRQRRRIKRFPTRREDCPVVRFDADGKRLFLIAQKGQGAIVDTVNWKSSRRFTVKSAVNGVLTRDGERLITLGNDRRVTVFKTTDCKILHQHRLRVIPQTVDITPDGRRMLLAMGNEVVVLDVRTGQRLLTLTGHRGTVFGASFSPDGRRIASTGRDGTIRIWGAAPGPRRPVAASRPR